MAKCKICGVEAGWFKKVHKECEKPVIKYLASPKSKKFHIPSCRYAKGEVEELYSFHEVVKKGYSPCKVCKP